MRLNNYQTTLSNAITASDTTITIPDTTNLSVGDYLTFIDNLEIIKITSVDSTTQLTVQRGIGGTTATDHSAGTVIQMRITAQHLDDIQSDIDTHKADTNNPHNVTAAQVGAITKIEEDTSPKLGGNLDPNGYSIEGMLIVNGEIRTQPGIDIRQRGTLTNELDFYNSNDNSATYIRIVPHGIPSTVGRSGFSIYNTDLFSDGTNFEQAEFYFSGTELRLQSNSNGNGISRPIRIRTDVNDGFYLDLHDNFGFGTSAPGGGSTVGTNILSIKDGTAPSGGVSGQVSLYSNNGELYAFDSAGNATLLSPHKFDLFQPDDNEPFPFSYYSENKFLGKKINIDMVGAIRAIEKLTGKKFIYIEDIEKIDWDENEEKQYQKRQKEIADWKKRKDAIMKMKPKERKQALQELGECPKPYIKRKPPKWLSRRIYGQTTTP